MTGELRLINMEKNNDLKKVLYLNKEIGETPLECINRFKAENPSYKDERIAYAGRLDPLASGVLLCLVGDECKNRDEYQSLSKIYSFWFVPHIETDSYDVLGKVVSNNLSLKKLEIEEKKIKERNSTIQRKADSNISAIFIFCSKRKTTLVVGREIIS